MRNKTVTINYTVGQLFGLNLREREHALRKGMRAAIILVIGGILLLAAAGKLLDNRYFAEILGQWQLFPSWSLLTLGMLTSLAELSLAVWLFSGWRLALAVIAAVGFHLVYVIATTITLLRGIHLPDCGCFGILFAHALDWKMVAEDSVLAVLCVVLFLLARRGETQ